MNVLPFIVDSFDQFHQLPVTAASADRRDSITTQWEYQIATNYLQTEPQYCLDIRNWMSYSL